jgi:hypothetical protein
MRNPTEPSSDLELARMVEKTEANACAHLLRAVPIG